MKITVNRLVESYKAISFLMKQKLPATIGYELALTVNKFEHEYRAWDVVNREKVMQYGEKTADGGYTVNPGMEGFPKFVEEMAPILEREIDVDVEPIKLSDLIGSNGRPVHIEPEYLMALTWLIQK